jgi:hypothetical protein
MTTSVERTSILWPADERGSGCVAELHIAFEDTIAVRPESQVATLALGINKQTLDRLRTVLDTVQTSDEFPSVWCV